MMMTTSCTAMNNNGREYTSRTHWPTTTTTGTATCGRRPALGLGGLAAAVAAARLAAVAAETGAVAAVDVADAAVAVEVAWGCLLMQQPFV